MTKFAKISLVAAVAVAGLTTANAQPLEEAIKGVDVSGMVRYRFETLDGYSLSKALPGTEAAKSNLNNYRIDIKTSANVNDMVKANVLAGTVYTTVQNGTGADIYTNSADINAGLEVKEANFAINALGATIIAGKQSIPGPFVDNTVDQWSKGSGVVALVPVAGVTLAAGTFNNTNIADGLDASEFAIIGNVAGISADVWYANLGAAGKNAVSVHANGAVAGVAVDARYTSKDNKLEEKDKATLTKIVASTKISTIDVAAGYVKTGKDNSVTNNVSIDGDNDAAVDAKIWQASMGIVADSSAWLVSAGTSIAGIGAKLTYIDVESGNATETLLDVSYPVSKNFTLASKYSVMTVDTLPDSTKTRIEAKYTF